MTVLSRTCVRCHPDHYASWSRTFHRTMTQLASPEAVLGDFEDASYTYGGVTSRFTRDGARFYIETLDTALKAADTGHLVFSTLHTMDATQTVNRVLSFYPPHQQAEVRFSLASALAAVVSLRLVPRSDKSGRIPACEVLINTAAVRDNIRDMEKTLNIPDLIKEGAVQYGMQSFDQSLMQHYSRGAISYESAVFYATSPGEFALRVQGVAGTSDTSWSGFEGDTNS